MKNQELQQIQQILTEKGYQKQAARNWTKQFRTGTVQITIKSDSVEVFVREKGEWTNTIHQSGSDWQKKIPAHI